MKSDASTPAPPEPAARPAAAATLTITDNRTGKQYELPIQDGTIRAMDLRQIKTGPDDFGQIGRASCRERV